MDVPAIRVWVDGRPVISQEAREHSIFVAVLSVLLPVAAGVIAIAGVPRNAAPGVIAVMAVVGLAWVVAIPWLARRRWVETVPIVYARYAIPISLFALAGCLIVVELLLVGLVAWVTQ